MSKLEQTLASTARMLCMEVQGKYAGKYWTYHNKLHRDFNEPAVTWSNGVKDWFQFGNQIK